MTSPPKLPPYLRHISDVGMRFEEGRGGAIFRLLSQTKKNARFDDEQLLSFAGHVQTFLDGIAGGKATLPKPTRILKTANFGGQIPEVVFKYVKQEDWDKFGSKGSFLLGSLARYAEMEDQGLPAGDRFEGQSFCSFWSGSCEITSSMVAGFDTLIFSTSADSRDTPAMREKFGDVRLQIDLQSFTAALHALFPDATAFDIKPVVYADHKVFRGDVPALSELKSSGLIRYGLAAHCTEEARLATVWAKPTRFAHEHELRIAFRFASDVPDCQVVVSEALRAAVKPT